MLCVVRSFWGVSVPIATCPKCGKPGECKHFGDLNGGTEFWDGYEFACAACGYAEYADVYGGSSEPFRADWLTKCPYCQEADEPNTRRQQGRHPFAPRTEAL
jgi:hypothetical protein